MQAPAFAAPGYTDKIIGISRERFGPDVEIAVLRTAMIGRGEIHTGKLILFAPAGSWLCAMSAAAHAGLCG